jgi:GNAT superfamily N-acetyltransferase
MCDDWMPALTLPVTLEQFRKLPRNPAYTYRFLNGEAYLTPRPKHYHAVLELRPPAAPPPEGAGDRIVLRPMLPADFPALEILFAGTFHCVQPFASLDDATLKEAARQCLEKARTGGDGVWLEQASFVAFTPERDRPVGAILITLLPDGDPCDGDSYYWNEPPPVDCVERRLGRPHLTWIFVSPLYADQGIGTTLLAEAVRRLLDLGYHWLLSTFLFGNESSLLWHWRNGFQLLPYPYSMRALRRQRDR